MQKLLIAIAALVLLAGATYGVWAKKVTPEGFPQVQTSVEDQSASWKSYENSQYGFSFKYPTDFELENTDVTQSAGYFYATVKPPYPSYQSLIVSVINNIPDPKRVTPESGPYADFVREENVPFGSLQVVKTVGVIDTTYYLPLTNSDKFLAITLRDEKSLVDLGEAASMDNARSVPKETIVAFFNSINVYKQLSLGSQTVVDAKMVKVGDTVGPFVVSSVYYDEQQGSPTIKVVFSGTATVTGELYPREVSGPGIQLTGDSMFLLPKVVYSTSDGAPILNGTSFEVTGPVVSTLPKSATFYADWDKAGRPTYDITAEVKDYTFFISPKEGGSNAELVKVTSLKEVK